MAELTLNQKFVDFLAKTPEALEHFMKVVEIYATELPTPPAMPSTPPHGPQPAVEGATHELVTKPLDQATIDKLTSDTADAAVIEKLHSYVSGFIRGITMVGG